MSACSNSGPITSEAFDRYLKARERISHKAKEHVEKLNQSAISRVKHQKLSEKYARQVEKDKRFVLDTVKGK